MNNKNAFTICSRCVMDSTVPDIIFDEKGICNYCKQFDAIATDSPNNEVGMKNFENLICNSRLVITDSGGIQEETTVYQVPCITIRKNTERPVTLSEGTNELIGLNMNKLLKYTDRAFNNDWKPAKIPELWDGKTSQRCVKIIEKIKFH